VKLYDSTTAPNPRRVRIFLAEKGVSIPLVPVDIGARANYDAEFREKNPLGEVPLLELDDGTHIAESVAICRYIEAIHPEPPLMGRGAKESALVEMWQRRIELQILLPILQCFRNTHEFARGRNPQVPEYADVCRETALERMRWLDGVLTDREFVAGDAFTIADITLLCAIDFGRVVKLRIPADCAHVSRWYATVSARPSARA
jgi:glutathione S-transferase